MKTLSKSSPIFQCFKMSALIGVVVCSLAVSKPEKKKNLTDEKAILIREAESLAKDAKEWNETQFRSLVDKNLSEDASLNKELKTALKENLIFVDVAKKLVEDEQTKENFSSSPSPTQNNILGVDFLRSANERRVSIKGIQKSLEAVEKLSGEFEAVKETQAEKRDELLEKIEKKTRENFRELNRLPYNEKSPHVVVFDELLKHVRMQNEPKNVQKEPEKGSEHTD